MGTNQTVRTGNRFIVKFDGKTIGLCQSVDMRDDYAPEPASGIGNIHAQEYVPTMARHNLSVEEMVLNTDSMLAAGIAFENGDDALNANVFDIISVDKDTGETLRKYIGCSYASGGVQVRKHAIVVSNATFNALDVSGKLGG
ncbi:MAG TPA: hypothetical protein PKZ37_14760 [Gallionellaceae bacterium]|jgi:hypothetical protein|nr:hypothetical protein [Gallionellaceae bacterium]